MSIIILSCAAQNNTYTYFINNLDDHYKGIYLNLYFIDSLKEGRNFSYARYSSSYLIVNRNITRYEYFDDDKYYSIDESELIHYQYEFSNDELIITDDFGNSFIKISGDIDNEIEIINIYIGEIVFDELINFGFVSVDNSMIRIPSVDIDEWHVPRFRVETFRSPYEEGANLSLYDCKDNEKVYLRVIDGRYVIYNYIEGIQKVKWIIW